MSNFYRHHIYQGQDYDLTIDVLDSDGRPVNTTGWEAQSQITDLMGTKVADLTVSFPTSGKMRLQLDRTKTILLSPRRYLCDVRRVDSLGGVDFYLPGDAFVFRTVTRIGA